MSLLLFLCVGYAAFGTSLYITAKGNIKDIKLEVDSKVPKNQLLFWGQADNEENTLNTLKDKSGNTHDGTLYNFDNTSTSGYNNDELILDGINDYVDIGLKNYNFQNGISYVIHLKINNIGKHQIIFGNWGNNITGGGIYLSQHNVLTFDLCNGELYNGLGSNIAIANQQHYTFISTYDGQETKLYINGNLENTKNITNGMPTSSNSILIGSYIVSEKYTSFADMSIWEAMIYDRALTQDEVKTITEGFETKYKTS